MQRRTFVQDGITLLGFLPFTKIPMLISENTTKKIPSLLPRSKNGRHFVFYSDSCSGVPGADNEFTHQKVNRIVQSFDPQPEFIAFPGDAVMSSTDAQWKYWIETEMKWLNTSIIPLYLSTSNHHAGSIKDEESFVRNNPQIPRNGPEGLEGLSYWVRNGNVLYISMHQPERKLIRKDMRFDDTKWLEEVLKNNQDAAYKIVAGHYPVFPVNGYLESPMWCFKPEEREGFWEVLSRHGVTAYLTSHVIAFDVKTYKGVLQICSGGAGTFAGPGGAMPGDSEYYHATQIAMDDKGIRYQVVDTNFEVREYLEWPMVFTPPSQWKKLTEEVWIPPGSFKETITALGFSNLYVYPGPFIQELILAEGFPMNDENRPVVKLYIDFNMKRYCIGMWLGEKGYQIWKGPEVQYGSATGIDVVFHPNMGPGGMLYFDSGSFNSMESVCAFGLEKIVSLPYKWRFAGNNKMKVTAENHPLDN